MPDQRFEHRHSLTPQQPFILDKLDLNLTANTRLSADAQVVYRDVLFLHCVCREQPT